MKSLTLGWASTSCWSTQLIHIHLSLFLCWATKPICIRVHYWPIFNWQGFKDVHPNELCLHPLCHECLIRWFPASFPYHPQIQLGEHLTNFPCYANSVLQLFFYKQVNIVWILDEFAITLSNVSKCFSGRCSERMIDPIETYTTLELLLFNQDWRSSLSLLPGLEWETSLTSLYF